MAGLYTDDYDPDNPYRMGSQVPQLAPVASGNALGGAAGGAAGGYAKGGALGAAIGGGLGLIGGIFGEIGAANQRRRRKKLAGEFRGLLGRDVYDQGAALSHAAQAQQPMLNALSRRAVNQYGVGQGRALAHFGDQALDARTQLAGNLYTQNRQAVNDNDRYYRGLIAQLVG